MKLITDQPDEFLPRGEFLECAAEVGSRCYRVLFLNAPHHHTHVLCFDHHGNAQGVEGVLDAVLYVVCQSFLYLQSSGKASTTRAILLSPVMYPFGIYAT